MNVFQKTVLKLKKNSPEILIVVGVAGIVVATIKACKASTKVESILDEHKEDVTEIKERAYIVKDERKYLAKRYGQTAWELFRLYAPSVAIGTASVCLIFKGHGILRKRYISLATAYGLLEKSYGSYRQNVIDELGEKMDQHFMYGVTEKEAEVTEVDKKGKEKKVTKPVDMIEVDGDTIQIPGWARSPYARVFTPKSPCWQSNSFTLSRAFAEHYEKYANDLLRARPEKPLYLETVYDWFGFDATKASHDAGWLFDPSLPPEVQQVRFSIVPFYASIDGVVQEVILMDFNCSDVYSISYRREI